jgi:hypothetical protein
MPGGTFATLPDDLVSVELTIEFLAAFALNLRREEMEGNYEGA